MTPTVMLIVFWACLTIVVPAFAAEPNPLQQWMEQVYEARVVTPAQWPFALHMPLEGELLLRAADGTGPEELGRDDVQWYNPANKPGDGLVYGINGAYVEKPEIYLGAGTQDERLAAHMAARYKELGKDTVGKPVTLALGGRVWTRFQITDKVRGADGELVKDDNGNSVTFDYLSYVTAMPTGYVNVVFLFDYPPHPDADIEAWAAKVLGDSGQGPT